MRGPSPLAHQSAALPSTTVPPLPAFPVPGTPLYPSRLSKNLPTHPPPFPTSTPRIFMPFRSAAAGPPPHFLPLCRAAAIPISALPASSVKSHKPDALRPPLDLTLFHPSQHPRLCHLPLPAPPPICPACPCPRRHLPTRPSSPLSQNQPFPPWPTSLYAPLRPVYIIIPSFAISAPAAPTPSSRPFFDQGTIQPACLFFAPHLQALAFMTALGPPRRAAW